MIKKILKDNKGEAYIDVVIFFMIAVFLFCFIIQMGGLFVTKLQLDSDIKQIVKLTQLEGGVTTNVDTLSKEMKSTHSIDKNGDGDTFDEGETLTLYINSDDFKQTSSTDYALQLGSSFTVTATKEYKLGFGKGIYVTVSSEQTGISEKHWKELS